MAIRSTQTGFQSDVTGGPAARASFHVPARLAATRRGSASGAATRRSRAPALRRPALAGLEAILLLVIVAAGLALLAGLAESARNRLRQDLATHQLALLREALTVYYLDTGTFPPGRTDLSATDAFRALRALPPSGSLLADWPATAMALRPEPADPWQTAYRYIAGENDLLQQVAGNGGWPSFICAGPRYRFRRSDPPRDRG